MQESKNISALITLGIFAGVCSSPITEFVSYGNKLYSVEVLIGILLLMPDVWMLLRLASPLVTRGITNCLDVPSLLQICDGEVKRSNYGEPKLQPVPNAKS